MRRVSTQTVANWQDLPPDESGRSDSFVWAAAPLVFIQPNAVAGNGGDVLPDSTFVFAPPTTEQSDSVADSQQHFASPEGAGVAPANGDTDAGGLSLTFAQDDGRPADYFLFNTSQHADALTAGNTASVAASSSEPLGFVGVPAPVVSSGLSTFMAHADFGGSAVTLLVQEAGGYQAPQTALDVSLAFGIAGQAATGSAAAAMPGPELVNAASPDAFAPVMTESGIGPGGATAAQVQKALDESGLSVNGTGIKVGVLSDSFNDLGGAAADEADGALPSAAKVQVLKDMPSGGTDEGRAMMQIIHDIAPGASLAFYTAFEGEQDFANGILALAASGAKVIVDDVSYFDEPFFQNGIVAQAIQTVEALGVTYVTAAGNDGSNGYQAAWTPMSGSFDGVGLADAESFGGSIVQTVTVGANYDVPLLLEWNQAYGAATSDLEMLVFSGGRLIGSATNATYGESGNPWVFYDLPTGGTYQIAIENLSGPNPGLIKEIAAGDGVPLTISGANVGTVYGHAMTPGVISGGAVSANYTPAFGVNPALSESFSSSGAGTELLFANNGTALSSPDMISPVAVSGIDDIATSVPGGLSDFYGTSASSASLAGVAALILSANPNLSPAAVEQIMEETAAPMSNAAISGAGLVQVNLAVAAAAAGFVVVGTSTEAIQGGAAISLLAGAPTITDPASTTLTGATIKIANGSGAAVAGDQLYINGVQSGSVGSGVTASWNATTSTLTLSGTASLAIYDTLLSEASYKDTGTDTSSGSHPVRTVSWSVNDGTGSYSTTSQVTIDRAPVASSDAVAAVTGTTVTKSASTGVLANDTDLDKDTLTVTGVSDTAHGTGTVGQSLAGVYGHLTLNANGSYSYIADNASAIAAAPTGSHPVDTFAYTVSDGNGGTATATLAVTLDRAPVVSAANVNLSAGHASVAVSSLFAPSDPDGDAVTTYGVSDSGPGVLLLNGVAQPNNQEIDVTAAQLAQLTFQSVAGRGDTLQIRAGDGTAWGGWTSFTVAGPAVVIQTDTSSFGSTSLTELGNNFFLDNNGTGPALKFSGANVDPGMVGPWTPIGAVQTASGYDVAWKNAAANQYTAWATDSSGNYVSNAIGAVSATDPALEALETTFNQDLNGDGTIGVPAPPATLPPPTTPPTPTGTVIQTDGNTSLTQVGSNYFLYDNGSGPELKFGSTNVDTGMVAPWIPIGAVQTASGYDVAWKYAAANEYTAWATDSSGHYVSNVIGAVSATDSTLEALETTFNQDLNGDGTIGVPAAPVTPPPPTTPPTPTGTVIQTDGNTSLTQIGSNYFLYDNGSGPELKFGSTNVDTGMVAPWIPIGAVQTASGYDVAWKIPGANQYTVWATDSSGHYVSNVIGAVSATNPALEAIETTFNQDLNGDGTIGIPTGSSVVSSLSHATGAGAVTIGVGATVEFAADHTGSVTFEGSTGMLRLDDAPAFHSEIFNFSGDGTLLGSDQIDLRDIDFNNVHDSYDNGVLTISDGTNTATLDFNGSYVLANFSFASDGSGGTIVYDPPVSNADTSPAPAGQASSKGSEQAGTLVVSHHDSFVFPSNLGSTSAADHMHDMNAAPLSQGELAHVAAIIAAIHDDSHASGAPDMLASAHQTADHFHYGDFFVK